MSEHKTKEEVIEGKKHSIQSLNNLLEKYIKKDATLRKADLISKWIKEYVNYLYFEDSFDPKRNISYKRGNIVKANFGFNLGSELGGVHYAVVIDNNNKHSSDTITVLPLSSYKEGKSVYERDLFIGSEFYNTVSTKYQTQLEAATSQFNKLNSLFTSITSIQELSASNDLSSIEREKFTNEVQELLNDLQQQMNNVNSQLESLEKNKAEIDLMKKGSIVKLEQIRTISKIRIWIPKSKQDPLYNISLSQPTMDKINSKMLELFIFRNNS